MYLTKEAIAAYHAAHPNDEFFQIEVRDTTIDESTVLGDPPRAVIALVRRPTRRDYNLHKQALDKVFAAETRSVSGQWEAKTQLLQMCCVLPTGADLAALIELQPGAVDTIGDKLLELSGIDRGAQRSKFSASS